MPIGYNLQNCRKTKTRYPCLCAWFLINSNCQMHQAHQAHWRFHWICTKYWELGTISVYYIYIYIYNPLGEFFSYSNPFHDQTTRAFANSDPKHEKNDTAKASEFILDLSKGSLHHLKNGHKESPGTEGNKIHQHQKGSVANFTLNTPTVIFKFSKGHHV